MMIKKLIKIFLKWWFNRKGIEVVTPLPEKKFSVSQSYCIYLDPGHGGINPHTNQYETAPNKMYNHGQGVFHNGTWFYEGVSNRVITNKVIDRLERLGINYKLTVTMDGGPVWRDVPLRDRVKWVNEDAKKYERTLFISNHSNAFRGNVSGWQIHTSIGETESDEIASYYFNLMKRFKDIRLRSHSYGDPDFENNFYVLKYTHMPAILVEQMFFDNYLDAVKLMQPEFQDRLAEAQVDVIKWWINK